jgi:hypothetical protein
MNDTVDWKARCHAYGEASEVPALIAQLSADTADWSHPLWEDLCGSLCHQGSVYSASYAALPLLLERTKALPPEKRVMTLVLMSNIVASNDLRGIERTPLDVINAISPVTRRLTDESLKAGTHDSATFVYLLQASCAFDGDVLWGRHLEHLVDGDYPGRFLPANTTSISQSVVTASLPPPKSGLDHATPTPCAFRFSPPNQRRWLVARPGSTKRPFKRRMRRRFENDHRSRRELQRQQRLLARRQLHGIERDLLHRCVEAVIGQVDAGAEEDLPVVFPDRQPLRIVRGNAADARVHGKAHFDHVIERRLIVDVAECTMIFLRAHALQRGVGVQHAAAARAQHVPRHVEQADPCGVQEGRDRALFLEPFASREVEHVDAAQPAIGRLADEPLDRRHASSIGRLLRTLNRGCASLMAKRYAQMGTGETQFKLAPNLTNLCQCQNPRSGDYARGNRIVQTSP